MSEREIALPSGEARLGGTLSIPAPAAGFVIFAHGSGSSRHSARNQSVAESLNRSGIATLLIDLLTAEEDAIDEETAGFRFDVPLLARRVDAARRWCMAQPDLQALPLGYFGASTGAGAALCAATGDVGVRAIVSRGGRPDLAGDALAEVTAPTLLIVGERDTTVLELNRSAASRLGGPCEIAIVPHATHLFEEPGALRRVAELARDWFLRHFIPRKHNA